MTDAEIKQLAESKNLQVIKTSAKTGLNVDESFIDMTKSLMAKKNQAGDQGSEDRKRKMGLAFKRL